MRVMIAAGGTGGHVYPALAAAEAIRTQSPNASLYFIGSVNGFERPLVEAAGVPFASYDEVPAGPLHGVGPLRMLGSAGQHMAGFVKAVSLLRRHRPHVILLTGGWVAFPVALAASLLRVPVLIFLPDIEPALSIKVLQGLARRVAITIPESAAYFPEGKTVLTGYPIRVALASATREAAIAYFGLDPDRKTLLVFGGSRGAQTINTALVAILPDVLQTGVQVIHVTGTLDWERVCDETAALAHAGRYHPHAYLHGEAMGLALAAADLVVSRSGAGVLAEFPLFGVPSVLVPYPYAWRYQKVNADYLAERGAAIRLNDEDMAAALSPLLQELLSDTARLSTMRERVSALAQPGAAERIAAELVQLATEKGMTER